MVIVIRIYWDLRGFATQIGALKHGIFSARTFLIMGMNPAMNMSIVGDEHPVNPSDFGIHCCPGLGRTMPKHDNKKVT